jgi:hypothetical protein
LSSANVCAGAFAQTIAAKIKVNEARARRFMGLHFGI